MKRYFGLKLLVIRPNSTCRTLGAKNPKCLAKRFAKHTLKALLLFSNNVSMSTYVYNKSIDHILISITNLKTWKNWFKNKIFKIFHSQRTIKRVFQRSEPFWMSHVLKKMLYLPASWAVPIPQPAWRRSKGPYDIHSNLVSGEESYCTVVAWT